MPYIFSPNDYCNNNTTTFEKFNLIVENYKHVIENDTTARCMIGFTAASMIRNEGAIDIDSVESWLQSIESNHTNVEQQVSYFEEEQEGQHHNKVNRILNVVKRAAAEYYSQEHIEEGYNENSATDSEDIEDEDNEFVVENEAAYELNRFVSRDPYSSTESHPTYSYLPKRTIVNYSSVDYLFFSLEGPSKTLPC